MAKQVINVGTRPNSKDGDAVRDAFTKVNQNFTELYDFVAAANLTELTQDYTAAMLLNGVHEGISVEYDDAGNKLNLVVAQDLDGGSASTVYDDNTSLDGGGA